MIKYKGAEDNLLAIGNSLAERRGSEIREKKRRGLDREKKRRELDMKRKR